MSNMTNAPRDFNLAKPSKVINRIAVPSPLLTGKSIHSRFPTQLMNTAPYSCQCGFRYSPNFFPVSCCVASVALPAKAAIVHILFNVAANAHTQRLATRHIAFFVTVVTTCFFMATGQLELGRRMIEIPCFPGSRVVAAFALDAEASLVLVFLFVALDTGRGRIAEGRRQMTFLALNTSMTAG